jgi:hypothetical protein
MFQENCVTFAVVREPLDRFVSGYAEVMRGKKGTKSRWWSSDVDFTFLELPEGPEKFSILLKELQKKVFNAHLTPQYHILKNHKIDYLIVFEYFDFDFDEFVHINNIKPNHDVDVTNKSNSNFKNKALHCLNRPKFKKILQHVYKEDFLFYDKILRLRKKHKRLLHFNHTLDELAK